MPVEALELPHSRPLPVIGTRCHELRITDEGGTFSIIYRADADAIIILDVFKKKTEQTPQSIIETCRHRLREYDRVMGS
ncbi:MAG: type II toxin-antitoxin system RelE/ParE family toxin [Nitrospira sp.]|nr:type II toxin-antitoxin system RelE/ParE family toxin [Nitrospira sp.]MBX3338553.1 type II toxin-antitoxin system RelE/ParE family toxin [Nitrospira sp.]